MRKEPHIPTFEEFKSVYGRPIVNEIIVRQCWNDIDEHDRFKVLRLIPYEARFRRERNMPMQEALGFLLGSPWHSVPPSTARQLFAEQNT